MNLSLKYTAQWLEFIGELILNVEFLRVIIILLLYFTLHTFDTILAVMPLQNKRCLNLIFTRRIVLVLKNSDHYKLLMLGHVDV